MTTPPKPPTIPKLSYICSAEVIPISLQRLNQIEKKLKWIDEQFGSSQSVSWQPFLDSPQLLAYHSPADELLYGGEPGGG